MFILDAIEGICEIIGEARILKEEVIASKNEFHQLLLTYKRLTGNVDIYRPNGLPEKFLI